MKDDAPQSNIDRTPRSSFQVGEDGISRDFFNKILGPFEYSSVLSGKPDFKLTWGSLPKEELKRMIFEEVAKLPSYTVYMSGRSGLSDLLTIKGKEMVKRLDEIIDELKNLAVGDPKNLEQTTITRMRLLLEEAKKIIYEK